MIKLLSFSKKQVPKENEPFDWKEYVSNIRTIQNGFHTLNAHQKGIAFNTLADGFIAVLESVFNNPLLDKDEEK